ncbi:MAG: GNAT family N-acetyltransferase [Candidatus Thorarchaeota archaeon]
MIREISSEEIGMLDTLVQKYVGHMKEKGVTPETVMDQMQAGLSRETQAILVEENYQGDAVGFLVINLNADRMPILFADWNFKIEKKLLDYAFKKLSQTSTHISFESGYPTSWMTDELPSYATSLGFVKHDRVYMQLQPIDFDLLSRDALGAEYEYIPFEEKMIKEISKLVFKSVDGTTDQELFPFVYGTIPLTEKFHTRLLAGTFGTHEPFYSWVLRENTQNRGVCFLTTRGDTGFVMHIVIDSEFRQQGLGKDLLCHSLLSLLRIKPSVNKLELAVTMSNPAMRMYESLGFRVLNDSSTFVWTP